MTGKIDPTKQYRTRDGREWKFLSVNENAPANAAISGAWRYAGTRNWVCDYWFETGGIYLDVGEHCLDLIEVRPRIQRKVWINVYSGVPGEAHESRKEADRWSDPGRTECLEVTLDYEEGEGL